MKTLEELDRLKKQAKANANRIRNKLLRGEKTNASHTFWEQVANDYAREASDLYRKKNSITSVSGVGIQKF